MIFLKSVNISNVRKRHALNHPQFGCWSKSLFGRTTNKHKGRACHWPFVGIQRSMLLTKGLTKLCCLMLMLCWHWYWIYLVIRVPLSSMVTWIDPHHENHRDVKQKKQWNANPALKWVPVYPKRGVKPTMVFLEPKLVPIGPVWKEINPCKVANWIH